jgi:hypothetical protein
MHSDQFQAKLEELIAEYPELTENQVIEADENLESFGYPFEEESDRVLEAFCSLLEWHLRAVLRQQ